ncbi:unnamed protein product [Lymnaea stagnalis]|uniref:MORN repeat-containing protein 1 n=1 Tax=Lymnaea stagnalis TaxID=6523 RepID=A0AAV2H5K3_LYMST
MADFKNGLRKEPYIGEKQKFLRDGYGTYVYENSFFRYEGEWVKGKKHGHGKLVMKDGTYYEGQFTDGEITGNGFKFFSSSNAKYTGQFLNGEMHGEGMMHYKDGSIYKGDWYKNRRQGYGTLWTNMKAVYEGSFYEDAKDGQDNPCFIIIFVSNGDRYEGHWTQDKRNGLGELWCADGSQYEGNFVNDLFHGEGKLAHASGMYYRGLWEHGFPVTMATKIVILQESPMVLQQGQPFSISVECRNDDDELVTEHGRELQVIAGFKYRHPEELSGLFDIIEDYEDQPIPTPFGYDVVPYPLTDQLAAVDSATEASSLKDTNVDKTDAKGDEKSDHSETLEDAKSSPPVKETESLSKVAAQDEGVAPIERKESNEESEVMEGSETELQKRLEELVQMPPAVKSKLIAYGVCEWTNLQLAPPPPMYRPFVIMKQEEAARKRSKQSKEKIGKTKETAEFGKENEENEGEDFEEEPSVDPVEGIASSQEMTVEENNNQGDAGEISLESQNSILETPDQKSSQSSKSEKEPDETVARLGEYVLIVQETTNPAFLGRRLQPAYLLVQLKKMKKASMKKPKWDTQRHITMSMHQTSSSYPDE